MAKRIFYGKKVRVNTILSTKNKLFSIFGKID